MSVVNNSRVLCALGLLSMAIACSNGSPSSPASPSPSDTTGAVTTIKGTTQESSAMRTAGSSARHASTTLHICVSGTTACTTVSSTGQFELVGDFSGDVRLQITDADGMATVTIPHVKHGETIVVVVNLNGTNASLQIVSRTGDDDGEDDGEDEGDDDGEDDDEDDDGEDDDGDEDEDDEDDDDHDHDDDDDGGEDDGEDDDDDEGR